MKPLIRTTLVTAASCSVLLHYVHCQWPKEERPVDIPPGKVEMMPGTGLKGILVQGQRDGMAPSLWFCVDRLPPVPAGKPQITPVNNP